MSTALAPAVAQGLRDRFAPAPLAIEQAGWRAWLADLFPQFVTHDFAPHHEAFWEWCWAIETYGSVVPLVACWPRGHAKSTSAELGAVALGARRRRRYGLYVCRTQDQSDDHVQTVGLDTAARGVKLDEQRPDFIILDDIDHEHDSLETVAKNKATITKGLLPAGTRDVAVLAVQNLIRSDGIFADLAGLEVLDEAGRPIVGPTFLQDRQLSGPVPALLGMEHETGDDGRIRLTAGTPTWVGFDLADCQEQVTRFGFTAFKSECQHDATDPAGGMFDHLEYRRCDEDQLPDLIKVAVAVDPAVSDKDGSDAHGIHADGLGEDGTIYRLASIERRMTPLTSLVAAIRLGFELGADVVVVEDDQGGDTWQSVFREAVAVVERDMPPCPGTDRPEGCGCDLHAFARWAGYVAFNQEKAGSIGSKRLRASLMLAAYELGWFTHVRGDHDLLERSLNRFPRKKPYDLVDSAFWAARELRPEITALRASRRWSVADVGVAA
jgi:hypothetical protein